MITWLEERAEAGSAAALIGLTPRLAPAADVLYRVVNAISGSSRDHHRPLAAWSQVRHDGDLTKAIIDRLLERGAPFEMRGCSSRTRHLKETETPPTRRTRHGSGCDRIQRKGATELREITCKTWLMAANAPSGVHRRQRLSSLRVVAGFEVSIDGRIWMSTEARPTAPVPKRRSIVRIGEGLGRSIR